MRIDRLFSWISRLRLHTPPKPRNNQHLKDRDIEELLPLKNFQQFRAKMVKPGPGPAGATKQEIIRAQSGANDEEAVALGNKYQKYINQ